MLSPIPKPDVLPRRQAPERSRGFASRPSRRTDNDRSTRTRFGSLALVMVTDELRLDTYAAAMIQAVTKAALRQEKNLVVLLSEYSGRRSLLDQLTTAAVDGAIVLAPSLGDQLAHEIIDVDERPVVFVGRTRAADIQTAVDVENCYSSAALVGHLLDTAGPRVGMIAGAPGRLSSELRLEGFRLAHAQRSLTVDESLIEHGKFSRITGYQAARQLLTKRPDAIFAANDEMGLGAALAASELGLSIPRDLSLAGFDGASAIRLDEPRLTSADQPFAKIAETAVTHLLGAMSGSHETAIELLEPELHFGWSTHLDKR